MTIFHLLTHMSGLIYGADPYHPVDQLFVKVSERNGLFRRDMPLERTRLTYFCRRAAQISAGRGLELWRLHRCAGLFAASHRRYAAGRFSQAQDIRAPGHGGYRFSCPAREGPSPGAALQVRRHLRSATDPSRRRGAGRCAPSRLFVPPAEEVWCLQPRTISVLPRC